MHKLLVATLMIPALAACVARIEPLGPTGRPFEPAPVGSVTDDPRDDGDDGADPADPGEPTVIGGGDDGDDGGDVDPALPPWDATEPLRNIFGGRFTGDIGLSSRGLDLPTDLEFVYDDGYYQLVEVYALRSDGKRVMLQLAAENAFGDPLLVPGVGMRFRPGFVAGRYVSALGCEGSDSGIAAQGMAFAETDFDEEPCDVGVDTEQDPEDPGVLNVTVQASFGDDCEDGEGDVELPDEDGDGDGDLPEPPPADDAQPPSDGQYPLTARASFSVSQ